MPFWASSNTISGSVSSNAARVIFWPRLANERERALSLHGMRKLSIKNPSRIGQRAYTRYDCAYEMTSETGLSLDGLKT
jgi:hypothetical protein